MTQKIIGNLQIADFTLDLNLFFLSEILISDTATATIGRMHVCSGTSADYTVTLPAASGNTGKLIGFRMSNALTKLVTLDGSASETIDGSLTRVMWKDEVAILRCDGSNWAKIAGKSIPMGCTIRRSSDQTGVVTSTVTLVDFNQTDGDNTGAMADLTNNRILIKRPGTYIVSGVVVWSGLTANSVRCITDIRKNGTGIAFAETSALSGGYTAPYCTDGPILAAGDYLDMTGFHQCGSNQSMYGGATGGATKLAAVEVPEW